MAFFGDTAANCAVFVLGEKVEGSFFFLICSNLISSWIGWSGPYHDVLAVIQS